MAFVIADRVRETTTTTGTGAVTLAGAYISFQSFATAIGNGNNTYYTIASASSGQWEVGIGTYTSSTNTLSRDTILASSNSGSAVNFSAGSKDVFVTQPAERSLLVQSAGSGLFAGVAAFTSNGVPYANSTTTLTSGNVLTFDGAQLGVNGITVGRGAGAVSTNTAVGASALAANTSGDQNAAFGTNALAANTTGAGGAAFGRNALVNNTTGSTNTAVGTRAMQANTGGASNTAVGYISLYSNSTGNYNTSIGESALQNNTTASNNTALGYQAAYTNTTGAGLTAVGYKALYSNTTGGGNTAVGAEQPGVQSAALAYNTTGIRNTAMGVGALTSNTTASENTAVGFNSMSLNTTGQYNTAIGAFSLLATTSGSNNTAMGYYALYANTTASNNTAVGYQAGYSNTTGERLAAFGMRALLGNTTGLRNSAFGMDALTTNSTGSYNTAVGNDALASNTTASNNTAVGYQAGYSQTTAGGGFNTFVGQGAGYANTTFQNTFIGRLAGTAVTSGSSNTFLGSDSGSAMTTGSNNTIVGRYSGNEGGLDIRTSSNNIVLSDGNGNPRIISDSSGYVSIGTNPSSGTRLFVVGADGSVGNEYSGGVMVAGSSDTTKRINLTYDASNDCGILVSVDTGTSWKATRIPYGTVIVGTQAFVSGGGKLQLDGGITFPATQSASSDANTLDDYEEGTWTPTAVCTGQTITYTSRDGTYTKIGNTVRVQMAMVINTVSGAAGGNTRITGLPFANGDSTYTGQVVIGYNDGFANTIYAGWMSGSEMLFRSGTRSSGNDGGGFTAGGYIFISAVYRV